MAYYSKGFFVPDDTYRDLELRFRVDYVPDDPGNASQGAGRRDDNFSVSLKHNRTSGFPVELVVSLELINDDSAESDKRLAIPITFIGKWDGDSILGDRNYISSTLLIGKYLRNDGSMHVRATIGMAKAKRLELGHVFAGDMELAFRERLGADIRLISSDQVDVWVAKFILVTRSLEFRARLKDETRVLSQLQTEFDYETLHAAIKFCYTYRIELKNNAFATKVRILAAKYQIPSLLDVCEEYFTGTASAVVTTTSGQVRGHLNESANREAMNTSSEVLSDDSMNEPNVSSRLTRSANTLMSSKSKSKRRR